jgi:hypothetical protein
VAEPDDLAKPDVMGLLTTGTGTSGGSEGVAAVEPEMTSGAPAGVVGVGAGTSGLKVRGEGSREEPGFCPTVGAPLAAAPLPEDPAPCSGDEEHPAVTASSAARRQAQYLAEQREKTDIQRLLHDLRLPIVSLAIRQRSGRVMDATKRNRRSILSEWQRRGRMSTGLAGFSGRSEGDCADLVRNGGTAATTVAPNDELTILALLSRRIAPFPASRANGIIDSGD